MAELIEITDSDNDADREYEFEYEYYDTTSTPTSDSTYNEDSGYSIPNHKIIPHRINKTHSKTNMTIICRDNITSKNETIDKFVNYCLNEGLFDDSFYDYNNKFSIVATKLNITFDLISNEEDSISKDFFCDFFEDEYPKDEIDFVFKVMDRDSKNYISWRSFIEFFLPFVKCITM